jgi:hypothetical protein
MLAEAVHSDSLRTAQRYRDNCWLIPLRDLKGAVRVGHRPNISTVRRGAPDGLQGADWGCDFYGLHRWSICNRARVGDSWVTPSQLVPRIVDACGYAPPWKRPSPGNLVCLRNSKFPREEGLFSVYWLYGFSTNGCGRRVGDHFVR